MKRDNIDKIKEITRYQNNRNDLADENSQGINDFFQRIQNRIKDILKDEYNVKDVEKFADYIFSKNHAKEIDMNKLKRIFIDKPYSTNKNAQNNKHLINKISSAIVKKYFNLINQNYFVKINNDFENSTEIPSNSIEGSKVLENLNTQEETGYAKEYSFLEFLKIISEHNNDFIPKNYLNRGKFNYLFISDIIPDSNKILDYLEVKRYFKKGFDILSAIKNEKIAYYFSILGNKLDYGFYSYENDSLYKIGEFMVNNQYLKKLVNFSCLLNIKNIIANIDVNSIVLLNKIKEQFINYIKKEDVEFLDSIRICKRIKNSEIPYTLDYENKHLILFKNWISRHSWWNRVYPLICQENDELLFIIKYK